MGNIANNSLINRDYGYHGETKSDTYCINGQRLDAYQFTNFLAGYSAQSWDSVYGHGNFPALGTLKAVGAGWHTLAYVIRVAPAAAFYGPAPPQESLAALNRIGARSAATFSRGYWDILNRRGGADIEAGAWHALDPGAALKGGSGYSKCGCD